MRGAAAIVVACLDGGRGSRARTPRHVGGPMAPRRAAAGHDPQGRRARARRALPKRGAPGHRRPGCRDRPPCEGAERGSASSPPRGAVRRSSSARITTAGSPARSTTPAASPRCSRSPRRSSRGLAAEPSRLVRLPHRRGVRPARRRHPVVLRAWHQVARTHREWGPAVPFYLDLEASGRPEFPLLVLGPVELRRFATRWCRMAERDGLLPPGWRFAGPSTGTHQWPFQLAGVPGLSLFNWNTVFERTDYHTTNDTIDRLDFAHLSSLSPARRAAGRRRTVGR